MVTLGKPTKTHFDSHWQRSAVPLVIGVQFIQPVAIGEVMDPTQLAYIALIHWEGDENGAFLRSPLFSDSAAPVSLRMSLARSEVDTIGPCRPARASSSNPSSLILLDAA